MIIKGGTAYVNASTVNLASEEEQSVSGLFNELLTALQSGKPVILLMSEVTPAAALLHADGTAIVADITGYRITVSDDDTVTVTASGGGGGDTPELPSDYQKVEYVEADGTQYTEPVELSIPARSLISIRFSRESGTNEQGALGIHPVSTFTNGTVEVGIASGAAAHGVSVWGRDSGDSVLKAFEDGTTGNPCSALVKIDAAASNQYTILFRYKTYWLKGRVYSCVIFKLKDTYSTEAPYEYLFKAIPCYRKADGVIGFYEVVSETFLVNAGTGSFTKGPDV